MKFNYITGQFEIGGTSEAEVEALIAAKAADQPEAEAGTNNTKFTTPLGSRQGLVAYLLSAVAKAIGGTVTFSGNTVVEGTNPTMPNVTTMASPTSVANRQSGDARWAKLDALLYGKIVLIPVNGSAFTITPYGGASAISAEKSSAGIRASIAAASAEGYNIVFSNTVDPGLLFREEPSYMWFFNRSHEVTLITNLTTGTVTAGDGITVRFSIASGITQTASDALTAAGVQAIFKKSGAGVDVTLAVRNEAGTVTTSTPVVSIGANSSGSWTLRTDVPGAWTLLRDGVAVTTVSGGPTTSITGCVPMVGAASDGTGTGALYLAIGQTATFWDRR